MKKPTGVALTEELLERIDRGRAFTPRSIVIENLLRERLGMEKLVPGQRSKSASGIDKESAERLR